MKYNPKHAIEMSIVGRWAKELRRILRDKAARRTFLEGFAFGLVLVVIGVTMLVESRATTIDDWKKLSQKYALTIAQAVQQSMVSSDLILSSMAESLKDARVETPEDVRVILASVEVFDTLKARLAIAPQIDVATIVALNGDVINFSRSFPPPPINLSDRDYFKALLQDSALDVFLSVPVQNRGTGTWTFYLARKIRGKSGEMLGALLTGIHSSFFSDYFERVALSGGSAISLFRTDGILMSRFPFRREMLGKSFAEQPAFKDIVLRGNIEPILTSAPRLAESGNSASRIVAPVKLESYPLIVNVTVEESVVMARWNESALWTVSAILIVFLLLVSLTWRASLLVLEKSRAIADMGEARTRADLASRELLRMSRLSTMQEMSSAIAHELNQPLSAAANYIAVARHQFQKAHALERCSSLMERANEQIQRAGDIIRRLRNFISRGQGEVSECEIRDLVSGAISFSLVREQHKDIELYVRIEPELPRIYIDRIQVQQVLLNLIRNAIEAMATSRRRNLSISAQYHGEQMIEFSVSDTGSGLDEAVRERLFQPFNTSKERGMGVGLSICRTIIEAHGGTIGVRNGEGAGATFFFTLPLGRQAT